MKVENDLQQFPTMQWKYCNDVINTYVIGETISFTCVVTCNTHSGFGKPRLINKHMYIYIISTNILVHM